MKWFLKPAMLVAIAFLVCASVLFFLPGSKLPHAGWMAQLQVDKWVHVGIFFLLWVLWRRALNLHSNASLWKLSGAFGIYGCLIEWIQHRFVPYRSFDVYDIVADCAGVVVAYAWWHYTKK